MISDGVISEIKENFVDEFIEHEETFVDEMKKERKKLIVFYAMYILCVNCLTESCLCLTELGTMVAIRNM